MATKRKSPEIAQRSHRLIETAQLEDARGETARALIEGDTQRALDWLASAPLRHTSTLEWRQWLETQDPQWTSGYQREIARRVGELLRGQTEQAAEVVRGRIVNAIEKLLPECKELVMGTAPTEPKYEGGGGGGGGTIIMKDPDTGERLTKINHMAALGYLRLLGDVFGVTKQAATVQVNVSIVDRLAKARRRVIEAEVAE